MTEDESDDTDHLLCATIKMKLPVFTFYAVLRTVLN